MVDPAGFLAIFSRGTIIHACIMDAVSSLVDQVHLIDSSLSSRGATVALLASTSLYRTFRQEQLESCSSQCTVAAGRQRCLPRLLPAHDAGQVLRSVRALAWHLLSTAPYFSRGTASAMLPFLQPSCAHIWQCQAEDLLLCLAVSALLARGSKRQQDPIQH